jgi:hypothetical protein
VVFPSSVLLLHYRGQVWRLVLLHRLLWLPVWRLAIQG